MEEKSEKDAENGLDQTHIRFVKQSNKKGYFWDLKKGNKLHIDDWSAEQLKAIATYMEVFSDDINHQ